MINRGQRTKGSAADTIPSKFQLLANLMASWTQEALISAMGWVPPSVRNKMGMDGFGIVSNQSYIREIHVTYLLKGKQQANIWIET